jgi:hypothetical protein
MRRARGQTLFQAVRQWLKLHPGQRAAIVTPDGAFVMEFRPDPAALDDAAVEVREGDVR